jgi:hypothetical protein
MVYDATHIEAKFKEHLQFVDETVVLVLKGHLLIEEVLDSIISKFVWHVDFLESASLRFAQKISLARAVSLDEQANPLWEVALALNALRNQLAHSLDTEARARKMGALREIYFKNVSDVGDAKMKDPDLPDQMVIYWSVALLWGFLDAFKSEAERFREVVDEMDQVMNPHRYKKTGSSNTAPEPSKAPKARVTGRVFLRLSEQKHSFLPARRSLMVPVWKRCACACERSNSSPSAVSRSPACQPRVRAG